MPASQCLFEMVGKSNSGPEYPQGHVPKPKSGSLITVLASRTPQNARTGPYGPPQNDLQELVPGPLCVHTHVDHVLPVAFHTHEPPWVGHPGMWHHG